MFRKLWRKVKRAVKTVVRVVKEATQRIVGILDLVASLIGIRPLKFLHLKVIVLQSAKGKPILIDSRIQELVAETKRIYKNELNVEIHPANLRTESIINYYGGEVPDWVLHPDIEQSDMLTDAVTYFDDLGSYIRSSNTELLMDATGYGQAIYAYVIDAFPDGKLGVGNALWQFCVISKAAKLTTLAHELGHTCGLFHNSSNHNLMNPDRDRDRDRGFTNWQKAWVRNSRFVTYLRS